MVKDMFCFFLKHLFIDNTKTNSCEREFIHFVTLTRLPDIGEKNNYNKNTERETEGEREREREGERDREEGEK